MCKKPLKGFRYGKTESGKDNYIIRSYDVDHLEILDNGKFINVYSPLITASKRVIRDFIEIPCGKCIECKLDYSRRWADRCMLEAQYHDQNCFITLTYDDQHIPSHLGTDPVTGEIREFKSLDKTDLQKFFKRLRQYINKDAASGSYYKKGDDKFTQIRYFACGEYGSQTTRPHYHAIIFGWKPNDLIEIGKNELGQSYFGSEALKECWDKGFHVVGECDWNSCAYVARYVAKKLFPIEKDFYEKTNIAPEFIVMSRRPGIGSQWYDDNKECYSTFLHSYLKSSTGSHKIGTVRYFDNKLINDFPKAYEDIKKRRIEHGKMQAALKRHQTSLPYFDYLDVENENLLKKTKILKGGQL